MAGADYAAWLHDSDSHSGTPWYLVHSPCETWGDPYSCEELITQLGYMTVTRMVPGV